MWQQHFSGREPRLHRPFSFSPHRHLHLLSQRTRTFLRETGGLSSRLFRRCLWVKEGLIHRFIQVLILATQTPCRKYLFCILVKDYKFQRTTAVCVRNQHRIQISKGILILNTSFMIARIPHNVQWRNMLLRNLFKFCRCISLQCITKTMPTADKKKVKFISAEDHAQSYE